MEIERYVRSLMGVAWLAWAAGVILLSGARVRRWWPLGRPAWLAIGWSTAVAGLLLAASFLAPFDIDDPGLMRVAGFLDDEWKAVSGRALVGLFAGSGPTDVPAMILGTRLFCLAVPLLVLVLARPSFADPQADGPSARRGLRPDPDLLLATVALVLLGPVAQVLLGVFSFWFVPVVQLTVLAAVDEEQRGGSLGSKVVLATGIPILAFARPEMLATAALAAAILFLLAARARRPGLAALSGTLFLLLAGVAFSVGPMLAARIRSEGHVVGHDAVPDATALGVALKAATRAASNLPRLVLAVLLLFNGIVVLAALGAGSRVRRVLRGEPGTFGWAAAVAVGTLVLDGLATSVHQEWDRVDKYWCKFAVALWFLGVVVPLRDRVVSRRVWRAAVIAPILASLAFLAMEVLAREPQGRLDYAMWRDLPGTARSVCAHDRPARRVLVVALDERTPASELAWQDRGMPWESTEGTAIGMVLGAEGCEVDVASPPWTASIAGVLEGQPGRPGLLCASVPQGRSPPVTGIVAWTDTDRGPEVERALENGAGCGWRVARRLERMAVLEREPEPPAPGIGGGR